MGFSSACGRGARKKHFYLAELGPYFRFIHLTSSDAYPTERDLAIFLPSLLPEFSSSNLLLATT
jgi:hypothetical protein